MRATFLLWCMIWTSSILAQEVTDAAPRAVLYDRANAAVLTFQTNGWGIGFDQYYKGKDAYTYWKLNTDLQFYRHEKEVKSYFQDPAARAYYYGKQNSFFVVRIGFGQTTEFAEKLRKNGVQINRSWQAGPSIGFVKPVYLQIIHPSTTIPGRYDIETEKFNPDEHYTDNIYGRASNLVGMNEMKIQMGIFIQASLRFEYSNQELGLRGVEIGATADIYPKRVEIMSQAVLDRYNDHAKNNFIFPAIYTRFFFGSKYNSK